MDLGLIQVIANEEIADISLYKNEAVLFAKKIIAGKEITKVFLEFSEDEERHLKILTAISGNKIKHKIRKIPLTKSLRQTLRMHLIREADSIKLYEILLHRLTLKEDKLKIRRIIQNEQHHYDVIRKYLLKLQEK